MTITVSKPILWKWSYHALDRWKEYHGCDNEYTRRRLENGCRRCGKKMRKVIRKTCPYHAHLVHQNSGYFYATAEDWVFVVKDNVVVTCFVYRTKWH